ncbi:hypothetical protein WICPIJ_001771 [Wickerhamomyces pijperi]|uniref:Uncharacterized protein n=1 Tax=Wickerhamomyces pijperi TaxID=599730 RepID=A0A9P8QCP2_WICPI|nr:hypothetical protein WICPIJ_001771 [Wickerhamomyces pijperi]
MLTHIIRRSTLSGARALGSLLPKLSTRTTQIQYRIPNISQIHTNSTNPNEKEGISRFPDPIKEQEKIDQKLQDTLDDDPTPEKQYLDTLTIFNELKQLGFNDRQCDLILRLIKDNLGNQLENLDEKILTTLELENELYLFEAATSELRVEIQRSRETEFNILNNEKNVLENYLIEESDELNKQLIISKNDSQVLINDQISENTLLQKRIKKLIQDLDNKISTDIRSDIKSEIESLRWHTTRNGIMAVLVLVFCIMGGTSISKRLNREDHPQEIILRTIEPEIGEDEDDNQQDLIDRGDGSAGAAGSITSDLGGLIK